MSNAYRSAGRSAIERQVTVMQWLDGVEARYLWKPSVPEGDGWRLHSFSAATGDRHRRQEDSGMPMAALLFFLWERDVPPTEDEPCG